MKLSADRKELELGGGAIAPGQWIWSQIPLSADFPGGVGKYDGEAIAEIKVSLDSKELRERAEAKLAIARLTDSWGESTVGRRDLPYVLVYGEDQKSGILCLWTGRELWLARRGSPEPVNVELTRVIPNGINRISFDQKTRTFTLWHNGHEEFKVPSAPAR